MKIITVVLVVFSSVLSLLSAYSMAEEPIKPIPVIPYDRAKAALGQSLFSDVRLSKNNQVSCASCHQLDNAGVDSLAKSMGINGKPLKRNTPTVYNAALNFNQMWDGRIHDLETRVQKVVVSPAVMGMASWHEALAKIAAVDAYRDGFKAAYGEPVSSKNIQHALAEFQRSLVLVNSPFDRFLRGDNSAISGEAKEGYELFKSYGCISCHQGANVGGNLFQKMGVLNKINWKKWKDDDLGRYNITGKEWDRHVFKVPSLRLAVKTAPYFHDGSVDTLRAAIDRMTRYQLDREVPEVHKDAIIAFLSTLPGERAQGDQQ